MTRKRVTLVQQGVWAMPMESMPLAIGYLKAAVDADEILRAECDTRIANLRGGISVGTAMSEVFSPGIPDVLAISVFGWNFRDAIVLSETFKQLNPDGLVILGGTHVANQADRVFRLAPEVDVIVNGEGEFVFPEILHAWLRNNFPEPGGHLIQDISFRTQDGRTVTTPARERIFDLDSIPSPFLNGAIPMADAAGRFRYDVAIMETNRGCPYKCSFCYWGGAIGQKVRKFSRERLMAELDVFAHYEVNSIILCDANFGMQASDEQFLEDVIKLRERTGFPRAIESSWAKNKSATFYRIVEKMKDAGLHSSFTVALQTLDQTALEQMNRRNMRLNDWKALVEWLRQHQLECYAEIIWGAPGETKETFLEGYDELALHVPRIAAYPLMILPNTDYATRRDELGLVTSRGATDDFEYVLATNTMTFEQNLEMQAFLLWARAAAENSFFRYIWIPLRRHVGLTQSQVLFSLAKWFDACQDPAGEPLRSPSAILEPMVVNGAVRALFLDPQVRELLGKWWLEEIIDRAPEASRPFLSEVFRFDMLTLPIIASQVADESIETKNGTPVIRRTEVFDFDVPLIVRRLRTGEDVADDELSPTIFEMCWRVGVEAYVDNHEEALQFMGVVDHSYSLDSSATEAEITSALDR